MTCERVRWLLSLDPLGRDLARDPDALRHLDRCDACRAFARALSEVDEALAARPLAQPRPALAAAVLEVGERWPSTELIEQPFSRAFWLFSAALTIVALVAGALLLQRWPATTPQAPGGLATQLWLDLTWPADASAWLSLQADNAAQVVLALMAGLVITLAAATAGFRAHARDTARHTPPNGPEP